MFILNKTTHRMRTIEHSKAVPCHPHGAQSRRPLAFGRVRILGIGSLRHLVQVVRAVLQVASPELKKVIVILVSFYQMVWQLANKILSVFCKSVRSIAYVICLFFFVLVAIIANHCFWGKNRFIFIKCWDLRHRHCSSLTLGRI